MKEHIEMRLLKVDRVASCLQSVGVRRVRVGMSMFGARSKSMLTKRSVGSTGLGSSGQARRSLHEGIGLIFHVVACHAQPKVTLGVVQRFLYFTLAIVGTIGFQTKAALRFRFFGLGQKVSSRLEGSSANNPAFLQGSHLRELWLIRGLPRSAQCRL